MTSIESPITALHAVQIDEDVVVLDLARDAYFCLSASKITPEKARLLGLAGDDASETPGALGARTTPPPLPTRDPGDRPDSGLNIRDLLAAARGSGDILLSYRGRSVSELIALVERHRRPRAPSADVLDLARRFRRWAPLAPVPGKCLVRSFMLLRYLQRHGATAHWVFGVRTWPFRAHCWVQSGEVVLDDAHERLSPYTPIMAVSA